MRCHPKRLGFFVPVLAILLLGSVSVSAQAKEKRGLLQTGYDLQLWCKHKSKRYFLNKGVTPYNWSANMNIKGDAMSVQGRWRVDGENKEVSCRALKKSPKRFAVIDMPEHPFRYKAHHGRHLLYTDNEIRRWCKFKSAQYFLQQDVALYNWAENSVNKNEKLVIKASWTVNDNPKIVFCSVPKGRAEKNATMTVQ